MYKEITGDIFSDSVGILQPDALCVTTNGDIKKDGCNVMGAGIAKRAKQELRGIDKTLGELIKKNGNKVQIISYFISATDGVVKSVTMVAFPTKTTWREASSLMLIEKSLAQLVLLADKEKWTKVILPRPGCTNGKLNWLSQVKPLLDEYLDERFYIIQKG